MESFIDLTFYRLLEETSTFKNHCATDEEYAAYEWLQKNLKKDDFAAFDRFLNMQMDRECEFERELFHLGFRAGFQFALESLNVDFKIKFP